MLLRMWGTHAHSHVVGGGSWPSPLYFTSFALSARSASCRSTVALTAASRSNLPSSPLSLTEKPTHPLSRMLATRTWSPSTYSRHSTTLLMSCVSFQLAHPPPSSRISTLHPTRSAFAHPSRIPGVTPRSR